MNRDKILEEIRPSMRERSDAERTINKFLIKLDKNLKNAKAVVGGSFAKDTWLKGNYDIDVFVIFNKKKEISSLKDVLKKISKKIKVIHGSRDYFQIRDKRYIFEIIPVLKISRADEAKNIMDASPLHVRWIKEHIGELADDIRLSKAFCIAQKVYGAESYIRGLSGYAMELLTIYYNGFDNLIRAAAKWGPRQVIDIKNYENHKELNKSKIFPLIIIDPVQKERNAAAALSIEKFNDFVNACKAYLKKPSESFFLSRKIRVPKGAIILEIIPLKGNEDIARTKAAVAFNYIKKKLNEEGFEIKSNGIEFDKKIIAWYKVQKKLGKYKRHYGPPVTKKSNLESFRKKWKNYKMHKDGGRVYVNIKRKFIDAEKFIKCLTKDKLVKERARKIKTKSL